MDRIPRISTAQKISSTFLNNVGIYGRESLDRVGAQAIGTGLYWADFTLERVSSTQVTLTIGAFWSGGKAYPLRSEHTFNFTTNLPQAAGDRRIASIVVSANEADVAILPREFLVDPTVDLVTIESRATATLSERYTAANALFSDPSPAPTEPAAPGGQLVVGWVVLSTSGVEDESFITLNTAARLPSNESNAASIIAISNRQEQFAARVDTIETDLANITGQVDAMPGADTMRQLFRDMANTKDLLEIPATVSAYGVEHFVDDTGSDTDHDDYEARLDEGVTFPAAASDKDKLSLFAANDPLMKTVNSLTLPLWTDRLRFDLVGRTGEVSFTDKVSQSIEWDRTLRGRIKWRWGQSYSWKNQGLKFHLLASTFYHKNWYKGVGNDATWVNAFQAFDVLTTRWRRKQIPKFLRTESVWKDAASYAYHPWNIVEATVAGRYIAQTFLASSTGYLTKLDLYFTKKGVGDVQVQICECDDAGRPYTSSVIASVTLASADINIWSVATPIAIPPTLLESGARYAIVLSTDAAHSLATVGGNQYLQGSLMTAVDGAWSDIGTADLAMRMHFAQFANTRTVVQLSPMSLVGGIHAVSLNSGAIEPEGTNLTFEYQKNGSGAWYPLDHQLETDPLASGPTVLNMRAIFSGTTDLQPLIDFTDADYEAWRPDDDLAWIGEEVEFGLTVTTVSVEVVVAAYDDGDHTLTASLIAVDGSGTETADSSASEVLDAGEGRRRFTFNFTSVSLDTCQIKIEGTTSDVTNIYALESVHWYGSS